MPLNRQLMVQAPGGSSSAGWKVTCSRSSLKLTLHNTVMPSEVRTSTSLIASSAALSTISSAVSWTMASIRTVPEKVAVAMSGSISMWYVSGSIVRGKRNGPEPGATADVGTEGIRAGYPRCRG